MADLEDIKTDTKRVYTHKAEYWHAVRNRSGYENIWLDRFSDHLPEGANILDLGCGTGDPIVAFLLGEGYHVTGVDYAPTMIDIAKANFPGGKWVVADMMDLPDLGMFDGLLSWDGFFHLSIDQQRSALPQYAELIKQGGALLLTVGAEEGEITGYIDDETIYHASLSPAEYEEILLNSGFSDVVYKAEDPDCRGRSVVLATGLKKV